MVLNFLRSGTIVNPLCFTPSILQSEFDFYGVDVDPTLFSPDQKERFLLQVDIALAPGLFSLAVFMNPEITKLFEKILALEEVKEMLEDMVVSIAVASTWCYSYEKKNASSAYLRVHALLDALIREGFKLETSTSIPTPVGQRHIHSFTYER